MLLHIVAGYEVENQLYTNTVLSAMNLGKTQEFFTRRGCTHRVFPGGPVLTLHNAILIILSDLIGLGAA